MLNYINKNCNYKRICIFTIALIMLAATVGIGYCNEIYSKKDNFNRDLTKITNKKSSILLVDINTGYIIGMSNKNIAYKGYTVGSLAKIITATALLEKGIITSEQTYDCKGYKVINGKKIYCWNSSGHGKNNIESALAKSCNLFFLNYSKKLNYKDLMDYYKIYKLDSRRQISDSIEIPEFNLPINGLNTSVALGTDQKILISPLSMLSLASTMARNGEYKPLWINKNTNNSDSVKLDIKPSTISRIQNGMTLSGKEGTANLFSKKGYNVAAKTGTAPYGKDRKHGWVIGYYPANKPQIAFCVFVMDGTGSLDAVPIAIKGLNLCKKYHYI